jgi:hypothetical protein
MRIIGPVIFLSFILVCCGSPNEDGKGEPLTETEVRDFISKYDEIWTRRDTNQMKETMADGYIYFTSNGGTSDRARLIGWFTPADKYKVDTSSRSEITVYVTGNTAIASTRWTGNGSFAGEVFNDDQRCSMVIQKLNGVLWLLSEHCTQIIKE